MTRILIVVLWLLHCLPLPILACIGKAFGSLLFYTARRRRHIVLVNLRLCFPEKSEQDRYQLAKQHMQLVARSLLERGLLWWSSEKRLRKLIVFKGDQYLRDLYDAQQPLVILAPHFVGLDIGGAAVAMRYDCMSMYAKQSNTVMDHWLYHGRSRFGHQILVLRKHGLRQIVKEMRTGRPFYYLPDMDLGRKDAVFVPFFHELAATVTSFPRLVRLSHAQVVTCVTKILPYGKGYEVTIGPAWENYPSQDIEQDCREMNNWIEQAIRPMPEQYYWVHRRFKTRPVKGEPSLYEAD